MGTPQVDRLIKTFDGDIDTICENLKWKFFTKQFVNAPDAFHGRGGSQLSQMQAVPDGMSRKFFEENTKYYEDLRAVDFMFDARGGKGNPAGGRWQRYINGKSEEAKQEKAKYTELSWSPKLQREFRAAWVKREYEKFQHKCKHVTSYKDAAGPRQCKHRRGAHLGTSLAMFPHLQNMVRIQGAPSSVCIVWDLCRRRSTATRCTSAWAGSWSRRAARSMALG